MTLLHGDCREILKDIKSNSIDLLVTDPPYGISFMGKDWDKALPDPEVWKECFRVLKEGKLAFIMCSPRQDVLARMIISLEDAGFRTGYTSIYWTYASGFPKAKNNRDGSYVGFQPKPAVEIILVVSKGKTLTWLDDCRIPYNGESPVEYKPRLNHNRNLNDDNWDKIGQQQETTTNQKGRFPANLLVSDDILNDGKITGAGYTGSGVTHETAGQLQYTGTTYNGGKQGLRKITRVTARLDSGSYSRYFDLDKWYSSKTFPFIITPKASKSERNEGCEDLPLRFAPKGNNIGRDMDNPKNHLGGMQSSKMSNNHPTVKPIKLMSYLITLGSREGDRVLDPFMGSGTTLIAAYETGRRFLGIEINKDYLDIAAEHVGHFLEQRKLDRYFESKIEITEKT